MTAYTVQNFPHAGATVSYFAPQTGAGANSAPCGAGVGLLVQNASGSSITCTILVPAAKSFDGLVPANRVVTVGAGADAIIPMVDSTYTDPATGLALFTISLITSITCAVIAIGA